MDEPLLREHKARERAALDALPGDPSAAQTPIDALPGDPSAAQTPIDALPGDPGAAQTPIGEEKPNDPELAALNAKNRTSLEPPPKKPEKSTLCQEIIEKQGHAKNRTSLEPPPKKPEKSLLCREIIEKQGLETPTLKSLSEQANAFAESAAGTSMAAAAEAFCRAAEEFADGKDRKKRVADTGLNKAAMVLFAVAQMAPSEAGPATVAINLTQCAQMVLLSDIDTKPAGWWRWRRGSSSSRQSRTLKRPSLKQWIQGAISAREPMLPIYAQHEKQLVDKREVLYTLALAAPLAILTAAAGLDVFHGAWALVAGASVGVWILAASGMVLNQYAVFNFEWLAARHLSRLGVFGAVVLFCCFAYRAFFPSASWALWLLLVIGVLALGFPWILSCIRGDDVISASTNSSGDAAGRAGKLEMRRGDPARRWTI